MYRKGFLDQQIEELGRALAKLLSGLSGSQYTGQVVAFADETFRAEFGLTVDNSLKLTDEALIDTLRSMPRFDAANLEKLADVFAALGSSETAKSDALYRKSLLIYRHIDASGKTFSMERSGKINRIRSILQTP